MPQPGIDVLIGNLRYYITSVDIDNVRAEMMDDWSYVNDKGKLTKRLENAIFKTVKRNVNLSEIVASVLTQYKVGDVYYRIVQKLSWQSKQYGDSSCMWTYHKGGRAIMSALGGMALVIRRAEMVGGVMTMKHGIGRSWLIPTGDGNFLMRNSYGLVQGVQLAILDHHFGKELKAEPISIMLYTKPKEYTERYGAYSAYNNGDTLYLRLNEDKSLKAPTGLEAKPPCHCALLHIARRMVIGSNPRLAKEMREAAEDAPQCLHCPWRNDAGRINIDLEPGHEA